MVPRRRTLAACALVTGLIGGLPTAAGAAAVVLGGTADIAYVEQAPAVAIASGMTVTGGADYAGQYLDVTVAGATPDDILGLASTSTPDSTDGVVSVVGSSVYIGNGTGTEVVGSIDSIRNGTAGNPLRVNFTNAFANAGFESGTVDGWTTIEGLIDLGVTELAGFPSVDTSTYPPDSGGNDDDVPRYPGTYTVETSTVTASEGSYALRLESSDLTTANGCDVVHGPAVVSDPFEATAGDSIFFDWRAFAGADAFHVFGYIIDEAGTQTEVLDTYATTAGSTPWATTQTVIPATGNYRFVFVAGTYDFSCGRAAGASLYIDNVRVFGGDVDDAVVEAIARLVTYRNSSDAPPATRPVTVDVQSADSGSGSVSFDIDITPVPDPPTVTEPPPVTFVNTAADDVFPAAGGTIEATDPEGDPILFALSGSTSGSWVVEGNVYTRRLDGTLATVFLDPVSGAYVVVADDAAVEATTAATSETWEVTATAAGQSDTADLEVAVEVEGSTGGGQTTEVPTSTPIVPGGSIEVEQCSFLPFSTVSVTIDGVAHTTMTANAAGCVSGQIDLPTDIEPGPHAIRFIGIDADGAPVIVTMEIVVEPTASLATLCTTSAWSHPASELYGDVPANAFYHDAASWADFNGIVGGRAPGVLAPNATLTRAEFVTMVHRMMCLPDADTSAPFLDVEPGRFYMDALDWTVENDVIRGTSPTTFDPEGLVTRSQLATILHRLAGEPTAGGPSPYDDLRAGSFYENAANWMGLNGLTDPDGRFDPDDHATRGEAIVMLWRFFDHILA